MSTSSIDSLKMNGNGNPDKSSISYCTRHHGVKKEVSFYCIDCNMLACHSCVEEHLHNDHDLKTIKEAIAIKYEKLESSLQEIQMQLLHLRIRQEEALEFEDTYRDSKRLVIDTAQELVRKIREHERRLLDEIETTRETEYKKIGMGQCKADLDDTVKNYDVIRKEVDYVLKKKGSGSGNGDPANVLVLQHSMIKKMKEIFQSGKIDVDYEDTSMSYICFNAIRCNTAFGTVEARDPCMPKTPRSSESRSMSLIPSTSPSINNMKLAGRQHRTPSLTHSPSFGKLPTSLIQPSWEKPQPQALQSDVINMGNGTSKKSRRFSIQVQQQGSPGSPISSLNSSPNSWNLHNFTIGEKLASVVLMWQINEEGSQKGQVNCPNDVLFLPDQRLAVSDRDNQRIQIFDTDGKCVQIIGEGKIKPRRMALTKNGHIALTDSKDNCVKVYDLKGNIQSAWGKKRFRNYFKAPCAICVNSTGQFLVSDMDKHTVTLHQPDGKMVMEIGEEGNKTQFQSPSYITVNHNNEIYIADNWNHCVKVFNEDTSFSFQFSKYDSGDMYLKYPNGVCVDEEGDVYVADWGNHLISKFSADGEFIAHVLTRHDNLYHPAGVATKNGYLAVSEYSDNHSCVRLFKL